MQVERQVKCRFKDKVKVTGRQVFRTGNKILHRRGFIIFVDTKNPLNMKKKYQASET
jgi:hypothetical protein